MRDDDISKGCPDYCSDDWTQNFTILIFIRLISEYTREGSHQILCNYVLIKTNNY